jgi:hypothetical protein
MKSLKLSKTSWLILAAGIFIVVLGSLGITRSQQLQEKGTLDEELRISTQTLEKLQASDQGGKLDDLQQKLEEEQVLLNEAKKRLDQTVVSVDVADDLFDIAEYCGVIVKTVSTTQIRSSNFESIGLDMTSINVAVNGEVPNLVAFVHSLNNDYSTGLVQTFQMNIPASTEEDQIPSATIKLMIYSYEGQYDGK